MMGVRKIPSLYRLFFFWGGEGGDFSLAPPYFLLVGEKVNAYKFEKWSYKFILIAY